MRVLLDECVPRKLCNELIGYEVTTVPKERLAGTKDTPLLHAVRDKFEVLVTVDRNLQFEQNIQHLPVAVMVLYGRSNRLVDLKPLVPELLRELNHIKPGQIVHVPKNTA
jgi:hypothetical protein